MSIIRITEGESSTFIEGGWTVFTNEFEAYAGKFSHFTAEDGTLLGTPDEAPKSSDNAFIPLITAINDEGDMFNSYEVIVNDKEEWTFSDLLDAGLQKQKSHEIKFKTDALNVRVKFKAEKGNANANDSDGGNITVLFFKEGEKKSIFSTVINDIKYGDTFYIDWNRSRDVYQVQLYADDNDVFFDGDVSNVNCGISKVKGSKVGRRLTQNIEKLPIASASQQLPNTHTFNFPEESFKVANQYQNPHGMCFAITMKRVEKAYSDTWNITDAIMVDIKNEDYRYSGTTTPTIDDKYFGYGVGGALAKNGYADLVTTDEIWDGKLEEGAMIQYWNNRNEISWTSLKEEIRSALKGNSAPNFNGGHSVIFKYYKYDSNGKVIGMKYYDYAGIHREFSITDKTKKIMLGANLKDNK